MIILPMFLKIIALSFNQTSVQCNLFLPSPTCVTVTPVYNLCPDDRGHIVPDPSLPGFVSLHTGSKDLAKAHPGDSA